MRSAGVLKDAHLAPQPSHIKFVPPMVHTNQGGWGAWLCGKTAHTRHCDVRGEIPRPLPVAVFLSPRAPPSIDSSVGRSLESRGRGIDSWGLLTLLIF